MEAVVHAGRQAQRGITPIAVGLGRRRVVAQQVGQGVWEPFGLDQRHPVQRTAGTQDGITGAAQDAGVSVHRAGAGPQITDKAVMQAVEMLLFGVRQVQLGKELPGGDGQAPHPRLAALAEPAHEAGEGDARHPVGPQKVQVLLLQQVVAPGANQSLFFHEDVQAAC